MKRRGVLGAASAPPIKLVTQLEVVRNRLALERKMYSSDMTRKFYNPTGVAVTLSDDLDDGRIYMKD